MKKEIWIVTSDEQETTPLDGEKGWGEEVRRRLLPRREVKLRTEDLEKNMGDFLEVIDRVFDKIEQKEADKPSKMQLDEVEMLVEVGMKGEVKLIAGGEIAGKGALKIKFKRSKAQ